MTMATKITTASTVADSYVRFVLTKLEVATIHGRLIVSELESAAAALRGGFIDADTALAWAVDTGLIAVSSAT
jgi:hypothetical protein